jgi:hypothetical protein
MRWAFVVHSFARRGDTSTCTGLQCIAPSVDWISGIRGLFSESPAAARSSRELDEQHVPRAAHLGEH